MEKYNGWTNRDTWLVRLWVDNEYKNYLALERKIKGIGTNKKFKDLNCCETMAWLKRLHYGDKIDWHNVNIDEIRDSILEEYES